MYFLYFLLIPFLFAGETLTAQELGDVKVSESFPNFGGDDISGNYLSSKSVIKEHKVVIVSYFATWCTACKKGMPIIEELVQSNDEVAAIYIDYAESDVAEVTQFVKDLNIQSAVVMDKFKTFAKKHGVYIDGDTVELPKTFVVGQDGKLHKIYVTEGSDFKEELTKTVEEVSKSYP